MPISKECQVESGRLPKSFLKADGGQAEKSGVEVRVPCSGRTVPRVRGRGRGETTSGWAPCQHMHGESPLTLCDCTCEAKRERRGEAGDMWGAARTARADAQVL